MKTFGDLFSVTATPVSEEELKAIEAEMKIEIPFSIRELYKISNGANAAIYERYHKVYYENIPMGDLYHIYDVENLKDNFNVFKLCEADGLGNYGTNRFIPFSDIGQAFICIGYTGEDLGKIFWMDTGNPINETELETFKLADSLQEFFDGLRPSE